MAKRDEQARKNDARAFASEVDSLVSATLKGEPPDADAHADAVRVAAAFVLLDRLVNQYATLSGTALATEEGVTEAARMLMSLRSGYDHPVWTYVTGIRTVYRMNRKPPIGELRRSAYAVGCIRALHKIDRSSVRAAAKALSERDYFRWRSVTFAMLRKWPEQLQEPVALDLADWWQRELIATAHTADDAMRETITALQALESADRVPSLTAAVRKRTLYGKVVDGAGHLVAEIEVGARKIPAPRQ